jgi:hypothetical protein
VFTQKLRVPHLAFGKCGLTAGLQVVGETVMDTGFFEMVLYK